MLAAKQPLRGAAPVPAAAPPAAARPPPVQPMQAAPPGTGGILFQAHTTMPSQPSQSKLLTPLQMVQSDGMSVVCSCELFTDLRQES